MWVYCAINREACPGVALTREASGSHDSLAGAAFLLVQEVRLLPERPAVVRAEARSDDLAAVHELVSESGRVTLSICFLPRRSSYPPPRRPWGV